MPAEGGDPALLTENEAQIYGLDWTPDSQEIVFSADTGAGGPQLWRVRANAPHEPPRPIRAAAGGARQPTLSRRESIRLVYQQEDLDVNVWSLDRIGAGPQVLTGSTRIDRQPDLAPDGRTVAFASNRSGRWEIWLSTHSGSNARPVTSSVCDYAAWPRWSPDGRRIAFMGRVGGKARVFVADADGGRVRLLTGDDADEGRASWSRDGHWIYFSASDAAGATQIWRAPADATGARRPVTTHGGFEAFEHPDGRALFFTRGRDVAGLWSLDLGTGLESPVVSTLRDGYWDVADDGVYYLDIHHADEIPQGEPVRVFRFASQRVDTVAMVPTDWSQILPGFAVDRAGTRFLWNQMDQHTSDLMLIDAFR
jgi:Tol biopolymer transport system component